MGATGTRGRRGNRDSRRRRRRCGDAARYGPGPDNADANGPAGATGTPSTSASNPVVESRQAVDDVAAKLTAHELDKGFGKVAVGYETARITVLWKGKPPADVAAIADTDPQGVSVTVRQSLYSEQDLVDAARLILNSSDVARDGATVAAAVPNQDRFGLVVEILKPWSGSAASLQRLARVPVTIRLVDEMPQPLTDP